MGRVFGAPRAHAARTQHTRPRSRGSPTAAVAHARRVALLDPQPTSPSQFCCLSLGAAALATKDAVSPIEGVALPAHHPLHVAPMCLSPSPSVRRRREAKLASLMAPGNIPMELPFGHSMPAETLPQYASQRVRVEPAVVECIKVRAFPIHVAQARGRAPYHTQSPPNLTTAGHPVCASDGNPSAPDRHQPNQAPRRPERQTPGFRQLAVAVDFNKRPPHPALQY